MRLREDEKSRLVFQADRLACRTMQPASLMELAAEAGLAVTKTCGAVGKCGKCKVVTKQDGLNPLTDAEKSLLTIAEREAGYRLACQARLRGDGQRIEVAIPPSSMIIDQRFQVEGESVPVRVDSPLRLLQVELDAPGLDDLRSDSARLCQRVQEARSISALGIEPATLQELSPLLRENGWRAGVIMRDKTILKVCPPDKRELYGVAVDLGTTKVALFLMDMSSGVTVDSIGFVNPQISCGDDVISRIHYANQGEENRQHLKDVVIERLSQQLAKMLTPLGLATSDVLEMCLVGNTAMHHFFAGLPVRQLGFSPFIPATTTALEIKASVLGMDMLPQGFAYLPQPIAGFVGSDHLAAILGSQLLEEEGPALLIDLGTNTELALKVGERIVCCSCACGPAFEGGALRHGMRAADGAIERVSIDRRGQVLVATVNDQEPAGICGSGILDAIAAFKEVGIVTVTGQMQPGMPGVAMEDGDLAFRLASSSSSEGGWVGVTQNDVREIQKAKGAIRAGINMLLDHTGISHIDLTKLIIAGGFGNYIDPESALTIALIPPLPPDRIVQVGNAAGVGARALLCSQALRQKAEKLAERIEYLELISYPRAELFYASAMMLSEESMAAHIEKWRH